MKGLEYYLSLDWHPTIEVSDEGSGSYRLTIPILSDFAVYGTLEQIGARFMEALASHLTGYLAVGKVIPEPLSFGPAKLGPAEDTASATGQGSQVFPDAELIRA